MNLSLFKGTIAAGIQAGIGNVAAAFGEGAGDEDAAAAAEGAAA